MVALTVETPGGSTIAAVVFAIAALTDGLDGYIARSRQSITTFGKVMDPVADKLMIAAALISLVSLDRVAAWVAMVIIAREFAVSGLRIAAGQQGVVIPASGLGKVKTIVQVAAVLALIAANDPDAVWVQALVYAMVARDGRLGRRLLPQLPPHASRRLARARPLWRPRGSQRRQALGQLLAARAAQIEHAVEELAVDVEHREQEVRRPDVLRARAPSANSARARSVDLLENVRAERGRAVALELVVLAAGHQRGLAHAECLEGRADLAVEAQRAKPALRLVLGGVGERHGGSRKRDHQGGVL